MSRWEFEAMLRHRARGGLVTAEKLSAAENSAVVLDARGDLTVMTAGRRAELGQRVFIIDPFGLSRAAEHRHLQGFLASYNPLLDIDVNNADCIDDAALISASIIDIPSMGETHWAESARRLLAGIILLVCAVSDQASRHVGSVRNIIAGTDPVIIAWGEKQGAAREVALFEMMRAMPAVAGGQVARVGAQILDVDRRERGAILSVMRTQCGFMDSRRLVEVMSASSFRWSDVETGIAGRDGRAQGVTVYLCLPASQMGTYGRWLRLMVDLALFAVERSPMPSAERLPTLFIVEE